MDLFGERGYENTTAAEIAERAGLAKSGFFRHFTDKREVLFFGQEMLDDFLVQAVADAPADATAMAAIRAALEGLEVAFPPDRREAVRRRQSIIDAHPELRERELVKRAAMTQAMAAGLRQRGVPDLAARLAAAIGDLALNIAYTNWLEATGDAPFGQFVRRALDDVRAATSTLR
ncbi:TetR family transcriptional regulator [Dactylosporangium sp. CA-092794]|uniref:TetR/AcrR family transcriptional regulator n=1 Tax=Dactylosporangium sp. CA-092794 TaxID=3239929 RepID=UPI003D8C348D